MYYFKLKPKINTFRLLEYSFYKIVVPVTVYINKTLLAYIIVLPVLITIACCSNDLFLTKLLG